MRRMLIARAPKNARCHGAREQHLDWNRSKAKSSRPDFLWGVFEVTTGCRVPNKIWFGPQLLIGSSAQRDSCMKQVCMFFRQAEKTHSPKEAFMNIQPWLRVTPHTY